MRGGLEINPAGVMAIKPAYEQLGKRRVAKRGFTNEITDVKLHTASKDFWLNTMLNLVWHRAFGLFLVSMWHAVRRVWAAAVEKARGSPREHEQVPSVLIVDGPEQCSEVIDDLYKRFIRGEPVSDDDDDDDFRPDDEGTPQLEMDSGDEDQEGDVDEEVGEQA